MGEYAPGALESPGFDSDPTLEELLLYAHKIETYINRHADELSDEAINALHLDLNRLAEQVLLLQDVTISGAYRIMRHDEVGDEQFYLEDGLLKGISHGFIIEPVSYFQDGSEIGGLDEAEQEISAQITAAVNGKFVVSHVVMCQEDIAYTVPLGSFRQNKFFVVAPVSTSALSAPEVSDLDIGDDDLNESERLLYLLPETERDVVIGAGYELLYSEDPLAELKRLSPQIETVLNTIKEADRFTVARFLYGCSSHALRTPYYIPPEQKFMYDDEDDDDIIKFGSFDIPVEVAVLGILPYDSYVEDGNGLGELDEDRVSLYAHAAVAKNPFGKIMEISIPLTHYAGKPAKITEARDGS